jgi:S-DNA-T family DNA segregation ATPase FtsK/SpoIIIE
MPAPRSKPEPHWWRHAAEVTPLAALALFAAVALSRAFMLPWWCVPAGVAAAGLCALTAVAAIAAEPVANCYAAACSAIAAGWVTYACLTSPWTVRAGFALAVPTLMAGMLYPVVAGHQRHLTEKARKDAEAARRAAEQRKWPDLLAKAGARGVAVVANEETRAGRTLRLALPASGRVTFRNLERLADRLETAGRLRHGAIRFEQGEHAGEALMHVSEKDILALTVPYPDDLSDLTVNRPFRVGTYEDGSLADILYREIKILIVGLTGAGKSNTLNVLIAQLGRCVDTVIFMIDQKGGRAALPWIQPWLQGRAPRPVVDWVATTRDESERMLRAILRGIDARAHSGAGGEKITPSAAMPAVVLIIDEMAVIFGAHGGPRIGAGTTNTALAGLGTQIVQLGRSEAIDAILATQRGTVTMTGGGDLKSQCRLRIGLGVASEADARIIIPDNASVARLLPKLKHPGTGIISLGDDAVKPLKFDRLENDRISAIAEELGHRRPEPDEVLAAALGDDYALRWTSERAGHIPGFARAAVLAAPGRDVDWDGEFERLTAGQFPAAPQPEPEPDGKPPHPARARMLEILRQRGVMGATPADLHRRLTSEGLAVARETVQRWLKDEEKAGNVRNATYGRWKAVRGD